MSDKFTYEDIPDDFKKDSIIDLATALKAEVINIESQDLLQNKAMFEEVFKAKTGLEKEAKKINLRKLALKDGIKAREFETILKLHQKEFETQLLIKKEDEEPEKTIRQSLDIEKEQCGIKAGYLYYNGNDKLCVNAGILSDSFLQIHTYFIAENKNSPGDTHVYFYEDGVYKRKSDFRGYIRAMLPMKLSKSNQINDAYTQVMMETEEFVRHIDIETELNADEDIINFKNGIYRISTGMLEEHSPKHVSSIRININYDKNVKPPIDSEFDKYIDYLTCGEQEAKNLLLEVVGLAISNISGYRTKTGFYLIGKHNTGKSQIKRLVELLVGSGNYTNTTFSDLEKDRFSSSRLYNKRLAGDNDLQLAHIPEIPVYKKITGGDSIPAEEKCKQGFEFIFRGLWWCVGNSLPRFSGDRERGVYDRFTIYKTNAEGIPQEKQNKNLLGKLYKERDYIISQAVNALHRLIDNNYRFTITDEMRLTKEEYIQSNNPILQFIEQKYETIVTKISKEVFPSYLEWAKDNNINHTVTKYKFLAELRENEFETNRSTRIKGGAFVKIIVDTNLERIKRKKAAEIEEAEEIFENNKNTLQECQQVKL